VRSREHAAALKRDGNTCQECQRKKSVAKGREVVVHVHHLNSVSWDTMIDTIYEQLLVSPAMLVTFCKDCHDRLHKADKGEE
jgi:5-methylcytosine-specific restriction endonuclease McrA